MSRSLAITLAAATLIGCSSMSEQPILQQFFSASRLRDNTTLAGFAAASFEPGADGIITSFTITNVSPGQRKPLALKSLAKAAEDAVAAETVVVDMSINGGPTHVDVTKYDGELVSKDVSIAAPVKLPSGQTAQKNYVVTMQRAVLHADKELTGRWIITAIKDAARSPATPRS